MVMGGDDFVKEAYLYNYRTCYLLFVVIFVMKPLVWMANVLVKCYVFISLK